LPSTIIVLHKRSQKNKCRCWTVCISVSTSSC